MNYSYKVYFGDDPEPKEGHIIDDRRKIKDIVTINITVEMEREKYEVKKKKYKEPISEKILKLFK